MMLILVLNPCSTGIYRSYNSSSTNVDRFLSGVARQVASWKLPESVVVLHGGGQDRILERLATGPTNNY